MTADSPDQGLAAALIQISMHAERIARLDTRCHDIATRLSGLAAEAETLAASVDTIARHVLIVDVLDGLNTQVATLARQLTGGNPLADMMAFVVTALANWDRPPLDPSRAAFGHRQSGRGSRPIRYPPICVVDNF